MVSERAVKGADFIPRAPSTPEEIEAVAEHATRVVLRRGVRWWQTDWEDARQCAVIGVLKALAAGEARFGYWTCYRSAKNEIFCWLRQEFRYWRLCSIYTDVAAVPAVELENAVSLLEERFPRLGPLLEQQRTLSCLSVDLTGAQRSAKKAAVARWGMEAVSREMEFIRLLLAGYSIDGVAVELVMAPRSIQKLRARLRARLVGILQETPL